MLALVATLLACARAAALGGGSKASAQLVRDSKSASQASFWEGGPNAAGAAEQEVEKLSEDLADGPDKVLDAAGGMIGQKDLMETKMPESSEAKGEAGKLVEDANLVNSIEEHGEASLFHKLTDGKNKDACNANVMLTWDDGSGKCTIHAWVIVAASALQLVIWGGIWSVVCKGKGRSKTPWDAQQLAMRPYKATGICTCCSFRPLAIVETVFCSFFMWAETMQRSGTFPTVILYIVTFIYFIIAPFAHGASFVFCMFRFVGRFKLRQKMESSEEQHADEDEETSNACSDLICMICYPCHVAQEAEYLELKANEGQPAPDGADLRHLLEWQVEHQGEKQDNW
jgi:hypothetical protein